MRVLVLGANGFIGRRVVAQLAQSSWASVVAAGRRATAQASPTFQTTLTTQAMPAPEAAPGKTEALLLDATDERALRRALAGITGVVNCVAGNPQTIIESARALFSAATHVTPHPRIVHLSSLAAYGSIQGAVDETVQPRGDLGAYSAAKLATEKFAAASDSVVTLRPGIVYGPRSPWWSDRIARLLRAGRLGDLGPAGDGLCNLVYVDDVATATLLALRAQGIEGRTFNLGLPTALTWNDYFSRYARALGAPPLRQISGRRLAIELNCVAPVLKLLELACRLGPLRQLHPPPAIRPWLLALCRQRIGMVVKHAESTLGMRWTALDDGLKVSAAWFLAGGRT
jgi:nucleoside-diphosphate-sugar epimerase